MDSEVVGSMSTSEFLLFHHFEVKQAHLGFRFLICKVAIIFLFKMTLTRASIPVPS